MSCSCLPPSEGEVSVVFDNNCGIDNGLFLSPLTHTTWECEGRGLSFQYKSFSMSFVESVAFLSMAAGVIA